MKYNYCSTLRTSGVQASANKDLYCLHSMLCLVWHIKVGSGQLCDGDGFDFIMCHWLLVDFVAYCCRRCSQNFKQNRNNLFANSRRRKVRRPPSITYSVPLLYHCSMTRCSCPSMGRLQWRRTNEGTNSWVVHCKLSITYMCTLHPL